jgi:hypothetical protein
MARAMFEYTKSVLKKVSFDPNLFCAELQKAMKRLLPYEKEELKVFVLTLIQANPELSRCTVHLV